MAQTWLCQLVEALQDDVQNIWLTLKRHGIGPGTDATIRGGNWEISNKHIAQWVAGTEKPPHEDASQYARLVDGGLEIRGGMFDITTADSGARLELDGDSLTTYDASDDQTFNLDFTTGDVTVTGVVEHEDVFRLDEDGMHIKAKATDFTVLGFLTDLEDTDTRIGHIRAVESALGDTEMQLFMDADAVGDIADISLSAYTQPVDSAELLVRSEYGGGGQVSVLTYGTERMRVEDDEITALANIKTDNGHLLALDEIATPSQDSGYVQVYGKSDHLPYAFGTSEEALFPGARAQSRVTGPTAFTSSSFTAFDTVSITLKKESHVLVYFMGSCYNDTVRTGAAYINIQEDSSGSYAYLAQGLYVGCAVANTETPISMTVATTSKIAAGTHNFRVGVRVRNAGDNFYLRNGQLIVVEMP